MQIISQCKKWVLFLVCFGVCCNVFADVAKPTPYVNPEDPYEKYNRAIFHFNERMDYWILKPAATLYNKILPSFVTKGISNFFQNIDTVPTVINDVLQLNVYQSASDAWRLLINSTIGIVGFFDVASHMGLEPNYEDLGLTFAHWGYLHSNYIVIPFFGPGTVRDGIAMPINYEFFTVYPYIHPVAARYELYALGVVDRRAQVLRYQGVIEQAALDDYTFVRDAYLQRRNYLIERNKELGDPYLEKNTKT